MNVKTATNPQTGERLQLVDGAWKPIQTATNPQTGERIENIGGQWRPLAAGQASPAPSSVSASPMPAEATAAPRKPGLFNDGGNLFERLGDNPVADAMRSRFPGVYRAEKALDESRAGSAVRGAAQGASFGFGDELAALPAVLPGGETYGDAVGRIRDGNRAAKERHPLTYFGGELSGAVATGGTGLARMGAVKGGAAGGAAYGAGSAEGGLGDRAKGGAVGAATGALFGKGTEVLVRSGRQGVRSLAKRLKGVTEETTGAQLERLSTMTFRQLDRAGASITPDGMRRLANAVRVQLDDPDIGFEPAMHPAANGVLKMLERHARDGTPMQLSTYRSLLKRMGRVSATGKNGGENAFAAGKVKDVLTRALDDDGIVAGGDLGPGEARALLSAANDLWRRSRIANGIDDAIKSARDDAGASGSGGNMENRLRAEAKRLMKNQGQFMGQDTRDALQSIVRGKPTRNAMRIFYKVADPTTGGLSGMLNTGSAYASGGATLPLNAAGYGTRKTSEALTIRDLRRVRESMRGADLPQRGPGPVDGAAHAGGVPGGEASSALTVAPAAAMPATPAPAFAGDGGATLASYDGGPMQAPQFDGVSDGQIMQMLDALQGEMMRRQAGGTGPGLANPGGMDTGQGQSLILPGPRTTGQRPGLIPAARKGTIRAPGRGELVQ